VPHSLACTVPYPPCPPHNRERAAPHSGHMVFNRMASPWCSGVVLKAGRFHLPCEPFSLSLSLSLSGGGEAYVEPAQHRFHEDVRQRRRGRRGVGGVERGGMEQLQQLAGLAGGGGPGEYAPPDLSPWTGTKRRKRCESSRWGFGWEIAHAAVSRRPPMSLNTMVARTHMYTYAAKVWD
jgi:hypothetical protein